MFSIKRNTLIALLSISVFFIFCSSCNKDEGQSHRETFTHNGVERSYILYKPDNLPLNAPLVFLLHGYTSNSDFAQLSYGMNAVADSNGFAVCYPQGTKDNSNINHWNANLNISSADDVGFLTSLAADLQASHNLDLQRTFSCGMSNGGFMSYTLACEAPNVFKAVASVTGTISGHDWTHCNPANPIPVLHIHGVDDDVVDYDGSMDTTGGWGGAAKVEDVVAYWATLNNCTSVDTLTIPQKTTAFYHRNGTNNHEVWLYRLNNWEHSWPRPFTGCSYHASDVIWEFFSKY